MERLARRFLGDSLEVAAFTVRLDCGHADAVVRVLSGVVVFWRRQRGSFGTLRTGCPRYMDRFLLGMFLGIVF
jgi:hypothetical protein